MARARTMDMTQGRILPILLRFGVPMMFGSLFQHLYNLADLSIAGYTLGDHALASIAATSALVTLINTTAMGFNTGNAILMAQSFGAGSWEQTRRCFAGMIELCLGLVVCFSTVLMVLLDPLMKLIRTPDELMTDAKAYITVLIVGLFATMLYNLLAGAFRAIGNSRVPLMFLIISSVLNVVLDIVFLVPLKMGVFGAALATVIAQGISAVLSGLYFYRHYPQLRLKKEDFCNNGGLLRDMLPMGVTAALTNSLFSIGDIAVQGALNTLGQDAIIAKVAARKLLSFCTLPSINISNACATFTAQNFGAKKLSRIPKGLLNANLFSIGSNVVTFVLMFLFGQPLLQLITNTESPQVLEYGVLMLRLVASCTFLQAMVTSFRMAVQSMKHKVIPMVGTGIELLTRFFCAFILTPSLGFLGICFAEPLSWLVSGAVMVACYFRVMKKERLALERGDRVDV